MKLLGWAVIGVLGVASVGAAWAGDPATVYRLTHPRSCLGCDASQAELPDGIDLSGYDLSKARLDGARARGANLQSAVLAEADLRRADLSGANLQSAVLTQADLREAHLNGARVQSAQWTGAKVTGIDLSGVQVDGDFSGFDLTQARFNSGRLTGARFVGAQLAGTSWRGATVAHVDFARAQATGADFTGARMRATTSFAGANLVGAKFFQLQLERHMADELIDFTGADLSGANFAEAACSIVVFRHCARTDAATTCPAGYKGPCRDFGSAVVQRNRDAVIRSLPCTGCELRGVNLDFQGGAQVVLDRADLSHASLRHFKAPGGSLVQVKLRGADVHGDFTRARLQGANLRAHALSGTFVEAQMTGADLSGADIQMSDYRRAVLINAKLVGTTLYGTDLRGANLTGADMTGAHYLKQADTDSTTTCPNGKAGPCW